MSKKSVHIAIALIRQKDHILIGWRNEKLHQGGCYEFPGGKVEAQETVIEAVKREVLEEVGVRVQVTRLFAQKQFDYGDKVVFLEFFVCQVLKEDLTQITQPWRWVAIQDLEKYEFPAANQSIVQQLIWSKTIAITTSDLDLTAQLPQHALCYLRKSYANLDQIKKDIALLVQHKIGIILNQHYFLQLDTALQDQIFAIHLNTQQLYQSHLRAQYPHQALIAACHTEQDILQANLQQCDAIFLSPVQHTLSHPEQQEVLGWERFAQFAKSAEMPVYALGGLQQHDLATALQHGAYGIAGIRSFIA